MLGLFLFIGLNAKPEAEAEGEWWILKEQ